MPINTDPPPPCKVGPCGYHCNCYNDIDWDKPGCQWCHLLEEEKKRDEEISTLNLQIQEMRKALKPTPQCDHKTEEEFGICNRCKSFARIARDAKAMLEARKAYLDQLLIDPKASDPAQYELQERIKRLEESVKFANDAKLWEQG